MSAAAGRTVVVKVGSSSVTADTVARLKELLAVEAGQAEVGLQESFLRQIVSQGGIAVS